MGTDLQGLSELEILAENTRRAFTAMGAALQAAFRPFAEAMQRFGMAYYAAAEDVYLRAHGRLPGSARTARLRKKRRDLVLGWFEAELERAAGRPPRAYTV